MSNEKMQGVLTDAQIQQIARDIGGYPINVRERQIWKFEASTLGQFAAAIIEQVQLASADDAPVGLPNMSYDTLPLGMMKRNIRERKGELAQALAAVDPVAQTLMRAGHAPEEAMRLAIDGRINAALAAKPDAQNGPELAKLCKLPDDLIALLQQIKPNYGDVGSRDIEVTAHRARIDAAIRTLASDAAPTPFDWHQISTPPSDERIVLMFCPGDEYPVWPGYFNGGWLHADGWDVAPTNWADMPEGPDVALINEGKTDVPAIDFGYMQSKASSKKLEVKP